MGLKCLRLSPSFLSLLHLIFFLSFSITLSFSLSVLELYNDSECVDGFTFAPFPSSFFNRRCFHLHHCSLSLSLSLRITPLCAWDYELIISHLDSMLRAVCVCVWLQDVMLWIFPYLDEITGIQRYDINKGSQTPIPETIHITSSDICGLFTI